jgi:hypothetical protein
MQRGEETRGRGDVDLTRITREVVLRPEVEVGAQHGRLDDDAKPTERISRGSSTDTALKTRAGTSKPLSASHALMKLSNETPALRRLRMTATIIE